MLRKPTTVPSEVPQGGIVAPAASVNVAGDVVAGDKYEVHHHYNDDASGFLSTLQALAEGPDLVEHLGTGTLHLFHALLTGPFDFPTRENTLRLLDLEALGEALSGLAIRERQGAAIPKNTTKGYEKLLLYARHVATRVDPIAEVRPMDVLVAFCKQKPSLVSDYLTDCRVSWDQFESVSCHTIARGYKESSVVSVQNLRAIQQPQFDGRSAREGLDASSSVDILYRDDPPQIPAPSVLATAMRGAPVTDSKPLVARPGFMKRWIKLVRPNLHLILWCLLGISSLSFVIVFVFIAAPSCHTTSGGVFYVLKLAFVTPFALFTIALAGYTIIGRFAVGVAYIGCLAVFSLLGYLCTHLRSLPGYGGRFFGAAKRVFSKGLGSIDSLANHLLDDSAWALVCCIAATIGATIAYGSATSIAPKYCP